MSGQSCNDDILLFIMRHGEAESLRIDDKSRRLTEAGREQVFRAARWLVSGYCPDARVDLALVSPYRRTRQTFDMLTLDIAASKIEISEDVIPEGNPHLVSDYIHSRIDMANAKGKPLKNLLVVSHMPLVSYLVDALCDSYTTSLFATASIAVIRYTPSTGKGELLVHYQGR